MQNETTTIQNTPGSGKVTGGGLRACLGIPDREIVVCPAERPVGVHRPGLEAIDRLALERRAARQNGRNGGCRRAQFPAAAELIPDRVPETVSDAAEARARLEAGAPGPWVLGCTSIETGLVPGQPKNCLQFLQRRNGRYLRHEC